MSSRRIAGAVAVFALSVAMLACDDKPVTAASTSAAPTTVAAPPVPEPAPPAQAPRAAAPAPTTVVRIASMDGAPTRDGASIAVGQRVEGGAVFRLSAADGLALDVAQSGRLSFRGPATLQLGTEAAAQVLAAVGVLTVLVPPAGDGKLIPQRVATPWATFTFRPGTTSVVAISRKGDVLVQVIAGQAEVAPTVVGTGVEETESVNPGATKRFDARGVASLKPAEDLQDALSKAQAFVKAAAKRPPSGAWLEQARGDVEAAVVALEREIADGEAIAQQHKQAIAGADAERRKEQQRALSAHGQRVFRMRRALLGMWERVQVAALVRASEGEVEGSASLVELRQRVAPVLPR